MTRNGTDNFYSFSYEFNRNGENKTVFVFLDDLEWYTVISVDWIQKGEPEFRAHRLQNII